MYFLFALLRLSDSVLIHLKRTLGVWLPWKLLSLRYWMKLFFFIDVTNSVRESFKIIRTADLKPALVFALKVSGRTMRFITGGRGNANIVDVCNIRAEFSESIWLHSSLLCSVGWICVPSNT